MSARGQSQSRAESKIWKSDAERTAALVELSKSHHTYEASGQIRQNRTVGEYGYRANKGDIASFNKQARAEFGSAKAAIDYARNAWASSHAGRQAIALDNMSTFRSGSLKRNSNYQAVYNQVKAGNLEPPTKTALPQPKNALDTATAHKAFVTALADKEKYDAWQTGPGSTAKATYATAGSRYGRTGLNQSQRYHTYSRLSDRATAAENRYYRMEDTKFRAGPATKIESAAAKSIAASIKAGQPVDLQALHDSLITKYVPAAARGALDYGTRGYRDSGAAKNAAIEDAITKAIGKAGMGRDLTIVSSFRPQDSIRGHLVEAVNTNRTLPSSHQEMIDRRNRAYNDFSSLQRQYPALILEGPKENPSFVTYPNGQSSDMRRSGFEISPWGMKSTITFGSKWTAADRTAADAAIHAQRSAASPVYKAFSDMKSITVRSYEQKPKPADQPWVNTAYRDVNVTYTPISRTGDTWTVTKAIRGQPTQTVTMDLRTVESRNWKVVSPTPKGGK